MPLLLFLIVRWFKAIFRIKHIDADEDDIGVASKTNAQMCQGKGTSQLFSKLMSLYTTTTASGGQETRLPVYINRTSGAFTRPEELGLSIRQTMNAYLFRQVDVLNAKGSFLYLIYTSDTSFSDRAIRVMIETERVLNTGITSDWRALVRRKVRHIGGELGSWYAWRWLKWYEMHYNQQIDETWWSLLRAENRLASMCQV
jgi:hypothetical protein